MEEEQRQPRDRRNRPSTRKNKRDGGYRMCPFCKKRHQVKSKEAIARSDHPQGSMLRVYIEPQVKQTLIDLARERSTTLSEMMRVVIRSFLADNT